MISCAGVSWVINFRAIMSLTRSTILSYQSIAIDFPYSCGYGLVSIMINSFSISFWFAFGVIGWKGFPSVCLFSAFFENFFLRFDESLFIQIEWALGLPEFFCPIGFFVANRTNSFFVGSIADFVKSDDSHD